MILRIGMVDCCYPPPGSKWFPKAFADVYRRRRLAVRYFCVGFLACLFLVAALLTSLVLWWF